MFDAHLFCLSNGETSSGNDCGNQLGKIRKVMVEYPQGWLSTLTENDGNKQAAWRTNPSKSGISGCMGDIGTHAAQLAEYISLKITKLCRHQHRS
jgi:predicted dehydrogenase